MASLLVLKAVMVGKEASEEFPLLLLLHTPVPWAAMVEKEDSVELLLLLMLHTLAPRVAMVEKEASDMLLPELGGKECGARSTTTPTGTMPPMVNPHLILTHTLLLSPT